MKIVCNSSVLITLEKAGILHILKDLFGEIFIPKAVRKEVFGRRRFPAFVRCIEISEPFALKVLGSNLEAGESEAICLYEEIVLTLTWILSLRPVRLRIGDYYYNPGNFD